MFVHVFHRLSISESWIGAQLFSLFFSRTWELSFCDEIVVLSIVSALYYIGPEILNLA